MSQNRNRHNSIAAEFSREKTRTKDIAVLYLSPRNLPDREKQYFGRKYPDRFSEANLLEPTAQTTSQNSNRFLNTFVGRFSYLAKVIDKVRRYTHLHIVYTEKVSLFSDILPLFILGKFFGKQVLFEHRNFNDYYIFEDIGILKRRIFKFADNIVVPSNNQRQALLKRKFPAVYQSPTIQMEQVKQRVIENVQPKILVDAHLEEVFNFHCLTKAFQLVKQKYPRTELVIKGSGRLKGHYIQTVAREKIQGIQFKDDVGYSDVDLFVNCYHVEYISEKILEAMSHGIPVISTPIGLIDNLVSKKNIMMFQFNDSSTLADHILALIEEPELTTKLSMQSFNFSQTYLSASKKRGSADIYTLIH